MRGQARQVRMRFGVALRARAAMLQSQTKTTVHGRSMAWWGAVLVPNTLELRQWKDIISCLRTLEECQKSI